MKKIVLVAAAVVALAACSKNEVNMPEASPISFAPNAISTKALILSGGRTESARSPAPQPVP